MLADFLASKLAKPVIYSLAGVLFFVLLCFCIVQYGNGRYKDGKADENASWLAASAKLEKQVAASSDAATKNEAPRVRDHLEQVAEEKAKIDEAVSDGRSPFDALFGVRADQDPGAR